jgi:hypothetical protein
LTFAEAKQFKLASQAKLASGVAAAELQQKEQELEEKRMALAEQATAQQALLAETGAQVTETGTDNLSSSKCPQTQSAVDLESVSRVVSTHEFSSVGYPAGLEWAPGGWGIHYPSDRALEPSPSPEPEQEPSLEPEPQPQLPMTGTLGAGEPATSRPLKPRRLGPGSQWKVVMSGMLNVRASPTLKAASMCVVVETSRYR